MKTCYICNEKPILKRSKTSNYACKSCFISEFEKEVKDLIICKKLFNRGETIAIGVSGGKDSSVVSFVMNTLNNRYDYGWNLILVAIDEGIQGYRNDSLEAVKETQKLLKLPLKILSYKEAYNWTMDEIVSVIGRKHNCSYCGVLRRHALEKAAKMMGAVKIATGHNVDDTAETIIMNLLRGDINRLPKCTRAISSDGLTLPRCKPLIHCYQKEIVLYAKYTKLDYFATECIYSSFAYRFYRNVKHRESARTFIKDLESVNPLSILSKPITFYMFDIVKAAEQFESVSSVKKQILYSCEKCGFDTSQKICQACVLVETLQLQQEKATKMGLSSLRSHQRKL